MPASITGMPRAFSRSTMASMARRGNRRIDAAQHVVGAEFDDDAIRPVGHRPVQPVEPGRGGIARHTRVDDFDLVPARPEGSLQNGREGGISRQPVARTQAVAESHDGQRAALCPSRAVRSRGRADARPHTQI